LRLLVRVGAQTPSPDQFTYNETEKRVNVLSLFSGIGGLELGLERAGMTVVGQVEIDEYCRRVLAKHWPEVPRHDDVRTAVEWWQSEPRPAVDVICGGFPCQDISNAGRRVGIRGERSGLWSYMADTVRVLRPRYVVMENVSAILVRGLDVVAGDLAEIGYDVQWDCIPAAAVGAPHRRDRWWAVAYPAGHGFNDREACDGARPAARRVAVQKPAGRSGSDGDVAYAVGLARTASRTHEVFADAEARRGLVRAYGRSRSSGGHWAAEPNVGRVADGIPPRVARDRLQALGNAVVPQVAEHVGRLLIEFDQERAA